MTSGAARGTRPGAARRVWRPAGARREDRPVPVRPRGMASRYRAFLTASVRSSDQGIVAFFRHILRYEGIDCFTVGITHSAPEPTFASAKALMEKCECLVVVATARFEARDLGTGKLLNLASGWIDSESGMAHMRSLPITVFKARGVDLQSLLGANVTQYFTFDPAFLPGFITSQGALLRSHLGALKRKMDSARSAAGWSKIASFAKVALPAALAWRLGTTSANSEAESWPCFGQFDGRTRECQDCKLATGCRSFRERQRQAPGRGRREAKR